MIASSEDNYAGSDRRLQLETGGGGVWLFSLGLLLHGIVQKQTKQDSVW